MRRCGEASFGCLRAVLRLATTTVLIVLMAGGLLAAALQRGPVELPFVADLAVGAVNRNMPTLRLEVGDAQLSLSRRTGLPVLSFNDVALADRATGRALMRVPRMSARFSMTALLVGRVEPVALVAVGPAARLVRLADGRVRFDLGGGEIPPDLPATEADSTTAPTGGFQAINRL
ncbi:MAG: hypothetical protein AAFR52_18850, partial [Pseudomonadota bacterium]